MKIKLMAHEDDTFTLDIETVPGLDPTGAEADFVSQLLETAFPVDGNRGMPDVRHVHSPLHLGVFRAFADFQVAETPQKIAKRWAEFVVDAVESAGSERDTVLRELAEELNRRGVAAGEGESEIRVKGGPWRNTASGDGPGEARPKRGPDVMLEDVQSEEAELADAADAELLRHLEDDPSPSPRPTPTPLDVLGKGVRHGSV